MNVKRLPALLLALSLGACATVARYDAAGDVHAFLVAIRDDDKPTFEDHVDRPALKAGLKARLTAAAIRRMGATGVLAQMMTPLVDPLVDGLVQPQVFLAIAEAHGYSPSRPLPGRAAIAGALRYLEGERVCVIAKRDGPCTLVFRNEGGTWRLVDVENAEDLLRKR